MTPTIRSLALCLFSLGPLLAQPSRQDVLKTLKFRELGPAIMGGRTDDFAAVESNTDIVYAGLASGGVWKTTNGGTTWEPVFDNEAVPTIGDVTVAPSDPGIVWVGTGEQNNRQSSSWGNGVYKTLDGGHTWQHMGLKDTHHIGRIAIHPRNANVVYVAALGHLWGPNKERGVYKTSDGGKTWTQVLFVNEDTGVVDIAMDRESPDTLYAAAYQRRRTAFGFNGGGPSGGLYKTVDGGANWTKLAKGLPEGGDVGRIGIDIYRRNANIVYVVFEHKNGGVFRSEDKGATWTKMSDTNPRPSYYSQIRIDPNNDQRIWVLGAPMYFSDDGGRTFRQNVITRIHGDYHALWINPANSDHMILGSDGGIHTSRDRGRTWVYHNTIAVGQFYEIGFDMRKPYWICGGLQDNNSWCGPSATLTARGISNDEWFTVGGGDGFYNQIDPTDPNTVYSESQDGNLLRRDLRTHESKSIRPRESSESEPRYRFQWNSPLVISKHDPKTIYYGGNFVFKSADRGDTWKKISPDLTTGVDRNKLAIMGKLPDRDVLSRNDGVQAYPCITTINESAIRAGIVWAGTDDGKVHLTRDGETWKDVTAKIPGVPKGTYVSRVLASQHAEGTAYVAFDGHRNDDFNPYLFLTTDFGETWTDITRGIPRDGGTLHVIREHHRNPNLLFAGAEYGLYVTFDKGKNWDHFKANLPTAPVDDIAIHPRENDLILGTHGRSIWILDDITPLEQMSERVLASDGHVFDVRPAIAWRLGNTKGNAGHQYFIAPNPPYGAIVNYYLKSKVERAADLKITILDKSGKLVRELRNAPREAGLQRINWDLRYEPPNTDGGGSPGEPEGEPGAGGVQAAGGRGGQVGAGAGGRAGGGGFFGFGGNRGPMVEPGQYTAKIALGGREMTRTFAVEEDTRIVISAADRAKRREALDTLYGLAKRADESRRTYTTLRTAMNNLREGMNRPGAPPMPENVRQAIEALQKKIQSMQNDFAAGGPGGGFGGGGGRGGAGEEGQPLGFAGPPIAFTPPPLAQRIGRLLGAIDGYTAAPAQPQLEEIAQVTKLMDEAAKNLRALTDEELPRLNKLMNEAGVPHITLGESAPAPAGRRRRL